MRATQSLCKKWVLLSAIALLGACSDEGPGTRSAASAEPPKIAKIEDGVRFSIDGPAFGAPTTFVVPGNHESLRPYLSDTMFNVMFRPKGGLMSEDGKHRLDLLLFSLESAGVGEFTESSNVTDFSIAFVAHADTPQSDSGSMGFSYRGKRHPVRMTVESYDASTKKGGASGHFTARMQRSNIKSTDQFYDAKGQFKVK